ncbi:MAG TPA: biopolymer transporter ExbD [Bacteroidales bacterium]|nr:biopolymer transporter ExbD [Bacteroidales bacterium]
MPKLKMPKNSPHIDMTPMVDLFTLLLTFFMLTTSFKPSEAVQVDTPNSISEKTATEKNVMTIYMSKDSKVYFMLDNGTDTTTHIRMRVLEEMGKQHGIKFTEEELKQFEKLGSFGFPMNRMKEWLNAKDNAERDKIKSGIPYDSIDNQLNQWVLYSRFYNPTIEAAVKGDADADYQNAKKVFDILLENKLNKFNLTTNLEKVEIVIADYKK